MHDAIRFDLNLYLDDSADRQRKLVQSVFECPYDEAHQIVHDGRIRRHARRPLWMVATAAQFITWVNARQELKGDWDGLQARVVGDVDIDYDMTGNNATFA